MQIFRSLHLQKQLGTVQDAVRREPVLFVNHGQPTAVMMSAAEFQRLKVAAGESVPVELTQQRSVTQTGLPPDSLGYDTSNFSRCASEMADAAQSGRNRVAVRDEIARAERRFGFQ